MVLNVVIMAAGKGTRMRSTRPKVLHRLAGRHLLQHVLEAAAGLGAARIIVVTGHGAAEVEQATGAPGLAFVRQEPQLGTAHALMQAAPNAFVQIHPSMALTYRIRQGEQVRLTTRRGSATFTAELTPAIRMDTLFVPFHFAGSGRANLLTNPALDPVSRMPEFKICAVRLEKGI